MVPGVSVRYKSTAIAELRNNPHLSLDRWRRIRDACAASRQSCNLKTDDQSNDALCLFDDCAIHIPAEQNQIILGRVQRMRKKGRRGYVEYVQPVSLEDRPANVEILYSQYKKQGDLYCHTEESIPAPLSSVICGVKIQIQSDNELFLLPQSDLNIISDFLNALRKPANPRCARNIQPQQRDIKDDGRRVDPVLTSRGRLSRRVSYLH